MRKIIVAEHISLDGIIQGPGSPKEDPSGDFRLGGWTVPYDDEAIGEAVQDLLSQPFELLLGRFTYDIWAGYWPHVPPIQRAMASPNYSTRRLSTLPHTDQSRLTGKTVTR